MKRNAEGIVEFLTPSCLDVRPVQLIFDPGQKLEQTLDAAFYIQEFDPPEGAVNSEPYKRRGFYVLEAPKCYVRKTRVANDLYGSPTVIVNYPVCFTAKVENHPSDLESIQDKEWYVGGYYIGDPREKQPLGENCLLFDAEKGQIDEHFPKKYRRVTMLVRFN